MSRFLKLENPIEISNERYGTFHTSDSEQDHATALHDAPVHFLNVQSVDEVVQVEHTSEADDGALETITACYILTHFEGGVQEISGSGPHDRQSWFLMAGTAATWLAKIEAAIAAAAALHHPETVGPFVDRGVWQPNTAYENWDVVKHPDNVSRYVCVTPHQSGEAGTVNGEAVLGKPNIWGALPSSE